MSEAKVYSHHGKKDDVYGGDSKVSIVKAMVFPAVMYGCESWTIKKVEHQRTDAFKLVLQKSPLDCKEIKPVDPKGNQPWILYWKDWHWSWSSNTLATWCEEPTHWKRPWCWERLRAGIEGCGRGWNGWMASPTQWVCLLEQTLGDSERQGSLACCSS